MPMHFFYRSFFSCLILFGNCYGETGLFFDVTESGTQDHLDIQLALNGIGPISRQHYAINALSLIVKSTIPHHTYPFAGIKLENPGYRVAGKTPLENGFYLFTVSDTDPAHLLI